MFVKHFTVCKDWLCLGASSQHWVLIPKEQAGKSKSDWQKFGAKIEESFIWYFYLALICGHGTVASYWVVRNEVKYKIQFEV